MPGCREEKQHDEVGQAAGRSMSSNTVGCDDSGSLQKSFDQWSLSPNTMRNNLLSLGPKDTWRNK